MSDISVHVRTLDSGDVVVDVEGVWVRAKDKDQAGQIADVARRSFRLGQRDARATIRNALGLRTWGSEVKCMDD